MQDSFKRQIDYLRISITDRCSLKCIYCSPDKKPEYFKQSEILTADEIIRFVRIASKHGLMKVRLTGGEPLMRKDLLSIISGIKKIGIRDLSLTTNGLMLAEMAGALKKAGLNRVNISLDTLDPDRYFAMTQGGDIRRVWEAIEEAKKAGLNPVKLNVVPIRGINDDEVVKFASLTFDNDYHVRFIELMPAGEDRAWKKKACVKKPELIEKISELGELILLEFKGKGPSRNYRLKGAKGIIGFISPISDCFCDYCNRLRLTAQGKIRPCLFSDIEIDIKTPMRNGISDEILEKLFLSAVAVKPAGHYLDDSKPFKGIPAMSKIGG
ncbi:MAG: GTP 3',8-cyclase MoaA [Nitrospirae bacterium]|nr:MAG: GTP 3',8-cyclase MoaA [Nitrospirota bacterium]